MRFLSPVSLMVPMTILGISPIQKVAAKCSDGLVNVVFNTGHGGFTKDRWHQIHSASNWLTFKFGLEDKQIPMLGNNDTAIDKAIDALNGTSPPDFLLTFNEPDNKYGSDPRETILYPHEAARLMKRLLKHRGNHTKLIAPVPAYDNLDWLTEFYGNCSCKNEFYAYNVHVYNETVDQAITRINAFRRKWNDKPLWITEIAPRQNKTCPPNTIPWKSSIEFMKDIYAWAEKTKWIEKVFWNSANEINCTDHNVAASFLLDFQSNPTPLLKSFNELACS